MRGAGVAEGDDLAMGPPQAQLWVGGLPGQGGWWWRSAAGRRQPSEGSGEHTVPERASAGEGLGAASGRGCGRVCGICGVEMWRAGLVPACAWGEVRGPGLGGAGSEPRRPGSGGPGPRKRSADPPPSADGKLYDAYVSYSDSPEDRKFVNFILKPHLERRRGYKLFLDDRDLLPRAGTAGPAPVPRPGPALP